MASGTTQPLPPGFDKERIARAHRRRVRANAAVERAVFRANALGAAGQEAVVAARRELEAADDDFKAAYAEELQKDPAFLARSAEAERQLAEGPPWDDEFSPNDFLEGHHRSQP